MKFKIGKLKTMKFKMFILVVSLLLLGPVSGSATEIIVSGAASLTNAFTAIKTAFEAANPEITVNTNFAASNPLLQQIREGAPADIFASADQDTMNKAEAENLIIQETRRNFALNSLVLIVPKGETKITGVDDLPNAKQIAIGNPDSVPAGRYAKASLESQGLWEKLNSIYIQGESVRQVLDYVTRAEVEAGFVYATDAFIAADSVDIVATMTGHAPVLYPVAVVAGSKNQDSASKFIDFLLSADGMNILKAYGFSPAD